jgi:hypothetical protein
MATWRGFPWRKVPGMSSQGSTYNSNGLILPNLQDTSWLKFSEGFLVPPSSTEIMLMLSTSLKEAMIYAHKRQQVFSPLTQQVIYLI